MLPPPPSQERRRKMMAQLFFFFPFFYLRHTAVDWPLVGTTHKHLAHLSGAGRTWSSIFSHLPGVCYNFGARCIYFFHQFNWFACVRKKPIKNLSAAAIDVMRAQCVDIIPRDCHMHCCCVCVCATCPSGGWLATGNPELLDDKRSNQVTHPKNGEKKKTNQPTDAIHAKAATRSERHSLVQSSLVKCDASLSLSSAPFLWPAHYARRVMERDMSRRGGGISFTFFTWKYFGFFYFKYMHETNGRRRAPTAGEW